MICQKFAIGLGKRLKEKRPLDHMKSCAILVLNSGSTSIKFGFYRVESSLIDDFTQPQFVSETQLNASVNTEKVDFHILFEGEISFSAKAPSQILIKDAQNQILLSSKIATSNLDDAIFHILDYLAKSPTPKPQAIAHRVVHGGVHVQAHCLLNDKLERELELASPYATLHNKVSLAIIKITRVRFPKLPQLICFDTAFHAHMPDLASRLPLPSHFYELGIKRYGFHGLSCESILSQLKKSAPHLLFKRLIIAHLGGGCSITAIKNGQSVDTTMGLTPSGGVMMGKRCGDIDPGLLLYLMREKNMDCDALEHLINLESGLLGVSGLSSDMRDLHAATLTNANAKLAIALFCNTIAKQIGAMMTVLNGLDALIITGGIGEHDAIVRQMICSQLACFGINLNAEQNNGLIADDIQIISDTKSASAVYVVQSKENAQIAYNAAKLLALLPE